MTAIAHFALPVVALALGACRQVPVVEDTPVLRVATYNIRHGRGLDGRIDLERVAAAIEALGADVVLLQEVDQGTRRAAGVDQARELGRLTGRSRARNTHSSTGC